MTHPGCQDLRARRNLHLLQENARAKKSIVLIYELEETDSDSFAGDWIGEPC